MNFTKMIIKGRARYISLAFLFLTINCNPAPEQWTVEATGTLQQMGNTTFQYGTHRLVDGKGNIMYALRSTKVNLSKFENKRVTVKGDLFPGYDGTWGPLFLEVTWLKK